MSPVLPTPPGPIPRQAAAPQARTLNPPPASLNFAEGEHGRAEAWYQLAVNYANCFNFPVPLPPRWEFDQVKTLGDPSVPYSIDEWHAQCVVWYSYVAEHDASWLAKGAP
jgi:hypothetical protein